MKKDMQAKEEIMEQELDQVAGGVNVTKVIDTVTKVVDTVNKVLPNKEKKNDGGTSQPTDTTAAPGGGVNQTTSNNTNVVNQNNVNKDNIAYGINFGVSKPKAS